MAIKIKQFHALPNLDPKKCPVYLRLPGLGSVPTRFEKQVKSAVEQCFSAVEPRVVYSMNELLSATNKDVPPALQKSNVIYQFSCHCDSRYVGRTSQRLQVRIKQHVPESIRSCSSSKNAYFLLVGANFPPRLIPSLLLLIQPLNFIFYKILPALNIMMTVDFLFLPKVAHLFICQLLKPLSSKLLTPPSADKKNSCVAWRLYTNDAFSLVLLEVITARLFPINSRSFSCACHSDDSSWQVSDEKLRRYEHFNQVNY